METTATCTTCCVQAREASGCARAAVQIHTCESSPICSCKLAGSAARSCHYLLAQSCQTLICSVYTTQTLPGLEVGHLRISACGQTQLRLLHKTTVAPQGSSQNISLSHWTRAQAAAGIRLSPPSGRRSGSSDNVTKKPVWPGVLPRLLASHLWSGRLPTCC